MSKTKAIKVMTVYVTEEGNVLVRANRKDLPQETRHFCSFLASMLDAVREAYGESRIVKPE